MNIENKKQAAIVLLAIGLGLVAAILMSNHIKTSIQNETSRLSQEYENKKIKPLMQEIKVMQKQVKELAARQVAGVQQGSAGKGAAGQAPAVPKSSLALRTPAGKRAYTVRIDALSAVGGLVNPGDYIDVIGHMNMPKTAQSGDNDVSTMVFQNVQILAVGTNLQAPGGYEQQQQARSLNITFALTPEECGLMSFLEKNGKMQLVLRAPAETETELMQVSNWNTLADYLFEKQGTELVVPRGSAGIQAVSVERKDEVAPLITIFQGGKALK